MEQNFYLQIERNLSKDRLDNYGKMDNADKETIFARYLWNIAVSQSLYQLLHFFEILLRNKINNAFIAFAKRVDWYNEISFDKYTEDMLNKAMEKLDERKINYDNGHLVAELNLGFWLGEDDEIHLSAFSLVRENKKVRYPSGKSDMATFYSFVPAA